MEARHKIFFSLALACSVLLFFLTLNSTKPEKKSANLKVQSPIQKEERLSKDKKPLPGIESKSFSAQLPPAFEDLEDIDEDEEDSELEHGEKMVKSFVYATPPSLADVLKNDPSMPSMTLVGKKKDEVSSRSGNNSRREDNSLNDIASNQVAQVVDALRELEDFSFSSSSRIGGARVRSGASSDGSADEGASEIEDEEDSELMPRYGGQTRGFMILALMHPNARQMVEKQIETLIRSQLLNVYVSFLVDGTFSPGSNYATQDFNYAASVIKRLATNGRSLTLELYFINGPTQRKTDSPIQSFFNVDPLLFRSAIRESPDIQAEFKKLVDSSKALFVQNKTAGPGNKNLACVMLEDNLDFSAYKAMRALSDEVLGDLVDYVRNPCPGCTEGSDSNPDKDGLELHSPNALSQLGPRDGLVLDGVGYNYEGETGAGQLTFEQALQLAKNAGNQGIRYLGLWRADRQGLGPRGQLVHPDERVYVVPSEEDMVADIQILQSGLVANQ
ncbi:MAG: hypothetical protein GYA55_00245 [SAR324 cluster bacterium]|uniref:Uncharacterized protein n=1 Tax=SAR324 cluster bacterium TaxID=2024889 RepID=A0A7X9IJ05_9DELT|nr:hypothetical protein [SAR324 cluster bacterium]